MAELKTSRLGSRLILTVKICRFNNIDLE